MNRERVPADSWLLSERPSTLKGFLEAHKVESESDFLIFYGNVSDQMQRITKEELVAFYKEEPAWYKTMSKLQRCQIAALCRFYQTKKGTPQEQTVFWWEKEKYIMDYLVLPLEGKFPELNAQYLRESNPSFRRHNICYLDSDLRRV